jgi:TRAP-type C4-dicarboxylate transport system substrate-binding protein
VRASLRGAGQALAAALLLLAGLVPCERVRAHGVGLELDHPYPADSAFHQKFLVPWAQKVEKDTGNRVRFHLHPDAVKPGAADDLYEKVRDGKTDVMWTRIQPTAEQFPALAPFEYPFAVRKAEGASRALTDYVRVNDIADKDFDGVRLLGVHVGDGTQLHMREAPGAIGGKRIAVATAVEEATVQAMGATPLRVAPSRIADALASGELDGALLSWERAGALGVDRAARFHQEFGPGNAGLTSAVYVLAMHPDSYRGMPEDLRKVFDANSGADTAAWLARVLDEAAQAARAAAQARGDSVAVMSKEEAERWRAAAQGAVDARTKSLEAAGRRMQPLAESAGAYLTKFDPAK